MNYSSNYKITEGIALQYLSSAQIAAMFSIFEQTRLQPGDSATEGGGLVDVVDYQSIHNHAAKNGGVKSGRVFFLQDEDTQEYLGFALCFDNVDLKSQSFPLSFYRDIIVHDISFVEDLSNLGMFGFIFQLSIVPSHQGKGCGIEILNKLEQYYQKKHTMILGVALHERQFRTIKIFTKQLNYWILDQYFSDASESADLLRFRIVYLMNKKDFFKTINSRVLPKTYKTVIPMQLNFAKNDVNRLIQQLDAKIIWTSFFNDSHVLRKYKMSKNYNGCFDSLLEVQDYEQFESLIPYVKEISNYLREKDSNSKTASLTGLLNQESFDFAFVNGPFENKDLTSFGTPYVFNLLDENVVNKLEETLAITKNRTLLNPAEQKDWWNLLRHKSKKTGLDPNNDFKDEIIQGKTREEWEKVWINFKTLLFITDEEEEKLIECQRIINQETWRKKDRQTNKIVNDQAAYITRILNRGKIKLEREKWEAWVALHHKLYDLDTRYLPAKDEYWWCHAVIPMGHNEGVSGIMFTFRFRKGTSLEEDSKRLNDLAQNVSSALSKNMFNIITKLQQRAINEEAYRYAVAAISSRNLSHNLGSHVLSRLSSVENIKRHLGWEKGGYSVKHFTTLLAYLRARMNLLADMSTTDPVASFAVRFNGEIIEYIRDQDLLLQYISGTELKNVEIVYENKLQNQEGKDIMVQSPNGELGFSAFAMILENIIRNTAKHEKLTKDTLTITISVSQEHKKARGYIINIFDDVDRSKRDIDKLVSIINQKFIESDIFSEGYSIRPSGWGIGEMKVAASYLRKKISDVHYEVEKKREIPFLKATCINKHYGSKEKPPKYCFGYKLYLKKPREILIIEPKHDQLFEQSKGLASLGIKTITIEESQKSTAIHSHQLVVLTAAESKQVIEDKKRFPFRWVVMQGEAQRRALQAKLSNNTEEAILWLWEEWIKIYLSVKGLTNQEFKLYELFENTRQLRQSCQEAEQHPENAIIFDSHAVQLSDGRLNNRDKYHFYEAFTSLSPTGTLLQNKKSQMSDVREKLFHIALLEAAITQILIIDERIQQEVSHRKETFLEGRMKNHTNFFEYLRGMNIHIPDSDQDAKLRFYEINLPEGLEANLLNWITEQMQRVKVDFVVFHIGLLEKLISSNIFELEKWIMEKIKTIDSRPEIIFISGRGKPHFMPNNISFQQYNNIARYVLDVPSKYHLCQMLFGARTTFLK